MKNRFVERLIKSVIICLLIFSTQLYAQNENAKQTRKSLYPVGKLFDSGQLQVGKNISIYYEQRGNPNGAVVVYNHGGPGGSSQPQNAQWFDPSYYRIIIYDQRGTGKSIPSVANKKINPAIFKDITANDMVADLEKLRAHLKIPQWVMFGGSWGSTLTLAYAEKYPQHVRGIVIYGIYLNQPEEMDQYYKFDEIKQRFPVLGEKALRTLYDYANSQGVKITSKDSQSVIDAFYTLCMLRDDAQAQYLWEEYEKFNDLPTKESLAKLYKKITKQQIDPSDRTHAVFETSIFRDAYRGFDVLDPELLANLKNVDVYILQSLQDTEAPPMFAKKLVTNLKKVKPDVHVQFVKEGRHDGRSSASMMEALLASVEGFKRSTF